ncbi:MAG: hypothetical protein H6918_08590 [Sphingomonadaceae bacterium]|nr:hypothetical protein [Sphingomonadaceae bacterium]
MTHARTKLALAASTAILCALPHAAHATGVTAGTLIENTASATYESGAGPQTVDSNTVTVTVDELLDVAIATQDAGAVPISGGGTVLTFEVTNTGNGPEAFDLTADPAVTGNDFDATVDAIAVDTNGNGTYDPGIDTILGAGDSTPVLAPDEALTVFVIVSPPAGISDGDTSQVNLLAEAATGTGTPGTVFTGAGESGVDAVVGSSSADADTNGALLASLATVALAKSAVIADPFGGSEAVPGAVVTYTLVATVQGSGSITNLRITDIIPTGTTYAAGTLTLDAASLTDADDSDEGKASAAGIDVLVGTGTAGTDYTVTFDVTID